MLLDDINTVDWASNALITALSTAVLVFLERRTWSQKNIGSIWMDGFHWQLQLLVLRMEDEDIWRHDVWSWGWILLGTVCHVFLRLLHLTSAFDRHGIPEKVINVKTLSGQQARHLIMTLWVQNATCWVTAHPWSLVLILLIRFCSCVDQRQIWAFQISADHSWSQPPSWGFMLESWTTLYKWSRKLKKETTCDTTPRLLRTVAFQLLGNPLGNEHYTPRWSKRCHYNSMTWWHGDITKNLWRLRLIKIFIRCFSITHYSLQDQSSWLVHPTKRSQKMNFQKHCNLWHLLTSKFMTFSSDGINFPKPTAPSDCSTQFPHRFGALGISALAAPQRPRALALHFS